MPLAKYNIFGRGLRLQIAITITCQIAFIFFGYDQGVFSGIVGNTDWLATFGHPSSGLEGIIVSIYNLGAFSGCILTFIFGERLGRRLCIWSAMGWIIVGAILQCTSYSVAQIMIARYVTGIGTGIETSTVPIEPLFVGVGIVTAYFFDYGMSFVGGPVAWRVPIACQTIFAFVTIFLVFGLPESPRWLYAHGRHEEALQVLCEVWDEEPEGERVAGMNREILEALELERENGEYRWRDILKKDEVQTGRRVLLAYGMQFMNQVGGINLVVYFAPTALHENVGLTENLSLVIGGCVNVCFIIGSLVPTFFLDKLGRRNPMMWGSALCGLSMMMISVLLSFNYKPDQYSAGVRQATSSASVAFFFTYMLSFGATANCIPWVYVPEILPLHVRAKGSAVGISANWLWNFVIVMITPTIIGKLTWKAYLIFMCTNFAFVPLVYFFYPETARLTLEEVDYLFIKGARKGLGKTRPVQTSLTGDLEKATQSSDEQVEHREEIKDDGKVS
ncbi:Sugar transporter TC2A11 family [Teratosphaeria destructans]|uniref:Sugar transporter TC2A11 family n=1 Tax=Teratosphaeria destructans TaxID=418781 RepID=A0A9W7SMW2_9PEZI|nr:Sugar transporter TC2A11 family [Teratosphaeria destructans]